VKGTPTVAVVLENGHYQIVSPVDDRAVRNNIFSVIEEAIALSASSHDPVKTPPEQ
jgi:hypothetical protein